jgi:hypothetical protein
MDDDISIYKEEIYKWPLVINCSCCQHQVLWTHFVQGIEMEGMAENYEEQDLQGFLDFYGHIR